MSSSPSDSLWGEYIATANTRTATPEQRQAAFDQWWEPEKADALASKRAEQRATKREQAKALRA